MTCICNDSQRLCENCSNPIIEASDGSWGCPKCRTYHPVVVISAPERELTSEDEDAIRDIVKAAVNRLKRIEK